MSKSFLSLFILLLTLNIITERTYCQKDSLSYKIKPIYISVYTGISVPIRGGSYWNHNWEAGYLGGGNIFFRLNRHILAGLRLNFNHWLLHESAVTEGYPSDVNWTVTKGYANTAEIVPSLRIILCDEYNKSDLFLQAGAGYFILQGNYSIAGTQYDNSGKIINYFSDGKTFHYNDAGLNLGIGIKGGRVEIFPLYSVIFTRNEPTNFVTLNVGFNF